MRSQAFATERFPSDRHHFSVWSPRVPEGAMTGEFSAMASEFEARGERLSFVINRDYGDSVQKLIDVARTDSRATSDPAYRLLQVLARVRSSAGRLEL